MGKSFSSKGSHEKVRYNVSTGLEGREQVPWRTHSHVSAAVDTIIRTRAEEVLKEIVWELDYYRHPRGNSMDMNRWLFLGVCSSR